MENGFGAVQKNHRVKCHKKIEHLQSLASVMKCHEGV